MSLDLAPDPVGRDRDITGPSPDATRAPGGLALTDAVARLSPQERAGLDSLRSTMDGQFAAIRGGGAPPPGFAAAVGSYSQVLGSLGLPGVDPRGNVLLAQAPAGAAGGQTRQQDPERVSQALTTVRSALSERLLDPDVPRADLRRVETTIQGLSRQDATAVVGSLSNAELRGWTSEIDGTVGGYSRADRGTLFGVLATRLDAAQLGRFASALETPTGATGAERGQQFGQALAQAPEAVRAQFVRTMAAEAPRNDAVGPAVGEALASLRGATLDRTLGALQQSNRLAGVVEGAVRIDLIPNYAGGAPTLSYDADTLGRVLRTAAASGNAPARATLVDAASSQLARVEEGAGVLTPTLRGDSVAQIRGGITSILRRDPVRVLETLEQANRGGGAFPDYLASMISAGQSAEVGQMLARVGTGNGTTSSAAWVTRQVPGGGDGRPYYANAQTLRFAVGSVGAAINSVADSRKAQGDMIKSIFGAGAGIAGVMGPVAGSVASVLTGLANAGVDDVVSSYVRGDRDIETSLGALAFPRNRDGSEYNGGAETPYDATVGRVLRSQASRQ